MIHLKKTNPNDDTKSFQFYDIVNKMTKENSYNENSMLIDLVRIKVKTEIFFGITIPKKFEVKFLDDDSTIVYPVGNHICFYDVIHEKTKYTFLDNKLEIEGVFTFDLLKYVIVEEKNEQDIKISFFDKLTKKFEEKSILLGGNSELINLTVSRDGIKCAIVYKNPKWKLSIWCLESFDLVSEIEVFTQNPFKKTINHVSFYPNSNKNLILFGNSVLASFIIKSECLNNEWNFLVGSNYTSHLWLNENHILIGDDYGQIILFNTTSVEIEKIFDLAMEFQNEKELFSKFNQKKQENMNLRKKLIETEDENEILNSKNKSSTSVFNQESIKSTDSNEKNSLNCKSDTEIQIQNFRHGSISNFQEIENQMGMLAKQTHLLEINQIIEISNGFIVLIGRNKIGVYIKNLLDNYELNSVGFLNLIDSSRDKIVII